VVDRFTTENPTAAVPNGDIDSRERANRRVIGHIEPGVSFLGIVPVFKREEREADSDFDSVINPRARVRGPQRSAFVATEPAFASDARTTDPDTNFHGVPLSSHWRGEAQ
jgi:hypothetical protein